MTLRENFIVNTKQFSQGTGRPIGRNSITIKIIYLQIARQVNLLTRMAKLCRAIRPPFGANEPTPAEDSLCLDTDFPPDIRRL